MVEGSSQTQSKDIVELLIQKGILRSREEYEMLMRNSSIISFRVPALVTEIYKRHLDVKQKRAVRDSILSAILSVLLGKDVADVNGSSRLEQTIIVNVTINYPQKETEELEKEEKRELSPEETVIQRLLTTFETWEQLQPEAKPYFEALRKPLYTNLDFKEKLKRLLEVARKLRDNDMLNDKAYQYIQKSVFEALKQKR